MTADVTGLVLGPWVWWRGSEGWSALPARALIEGAPAAGLVTLVYEPEGIGHERVAGWYRTRGEFSESIRNRERFPQIERETCGWGFDSVHVDSAAAETFVHTESREELRATIRSMTTQGREVSAAWSLFSVIVSLARRPANLEASPVILVVARDYAAVGFYDLDGGPCSFKSWTGPFTDQIWRAVLVTLRELHVAAEVAPGGSPNLPGRCLRVFSEGEEIRQSGRLATWSTVPDVVELCGFDELCADVAGMKRGLAANLALSFPRVIDLSKRARRLAGAAFCSTVILGLCVLRFVQAIAAEGARHAAAVVVQHEEDGALSRRREAISQTAPVDPVPPAEIVSVLDRLGGALPVDTTIRVFEVLGSGLVQIEGRSADVAATRQSLAVALAHTGLACDALTVDPVSGDWHGTFHLHGGGHAR